jgi:hypothetical protein
VLRCRGEGERWSRGFLESPASPYTLYYYYYYYYYN